MLRYVPAVFALLVSFNCSAELRSTSPGEACTLLSDTHLRAGEWSHNAEGREGCWSVARPVAANAPPGNTIAFSAEGANGTPARLRLVMDVASPADEDQAKRELVRATKRLAVRALGLSIPYTAEQSIMKGAPSRLEVGTGTITITRIAGLKGNYRMAVVME